MIRLSPGEEPPFDEGFYQLHLKLSHPVSVVIGALGVHTVPAGHYIYTGSARRGLRARLARHQSRNKALRWHIDYFLRPSTCSRHRSARITAINVFEIGETNECTLARESLLLPGSQIVVRGFGSSDCRCPSHLVLVR